MIQSIPRNDAIGAALMIVTCHLVLAMANGVFSGVLMDTDAYMWMNRVIHLHETGSWYDINYPRINPPFGHEQHWTRPFDVLLWLGATLGTPFIGFEAALHVWAAMLGPILQVLALLSFLWALLPVANDRKLEALGILFVCQAGILFSFLAGRADHQALLYLLSILVMGFTVRMLLQPFNLRWCLGAGLVSAVALWVSMESLLVVFISFVALISLWFGGNEGAEKKLFYYSLIFFLMTLLALIIEKGGNGFWQPHYDQISIVYIVAAALNWLLWLMAYTIRERMVIHLGVGRRVLLFVLTAAIAAAFLEWLFNGFFYGPLQTVDALYQRVRLTHISELQSIFSNEGWSSWKGLAHFIFWLGIALPVIPFLLYQLLRGDAQYRIFWIFVAMGVALFLPLAIRQIRWIPYATIFLLPAYSWLVASMVDWLAKRRALHGFAGLKVAVYTLSVFWVFVPTVLLASAKAETPRERIGERCSLPAVSNYLDEPGVWGDRPRKILASTDLGPELLYRTDHMVYSIPNHRFQQGFTDTYNLFSAKEVSEAKRIVQKLDAELILLCLNSGEHSFYERGDGKGNFYNALATGNSPQWLQSVALPKALSQTVRLYEVTMDRVK